MSDPAYIHIVYIRATPQRVWDALTDPEQTAKFWFGSRGESDWKAGSALAFKRNGGTDFTGQVLEADPPRRLVFTFQHGPQHAADTAPSTVTYELDTEGEATRLTVIHDGFPDNSVVRPSISKGWPKILSGLKTLLETDRELVLTD